MKKLWTVTLSLLAACTLVVSMICIGGMGVSAAVTGTFVDTIVPEFAIPEIVDYSAVGDDLMNTHRMACEANPDLGATLLIKQAEPRDPGHTEYITYKMAKNIAGFEFQTMCCAGLGNPLEDITVFISKTGAEGTWATVKTQATRYTYDPDIYLHFDKAYWHQSTLMNAQKIPTGYKYLKIQFNPCTDKNDVPWNIAIDTVTITMGSNVAVPVIPEDQTFLTYEELANQPTTKPTEPSEPTTPSTPSTGPSSEPTTPSTKPTQPEAPSKNPCFAIGSVSGKPGDVVTVPVTVYNNPGIVGAQVGVSYNKEALTLAAMDGQDFAGVEFGPLDADVASMIWLDAINGNNTQNGVLANLTFVINDAAAAGEYALDLVCVDANNIFDADLQPVTFEFIDGVVTVEEDVVVPAYIPGDVNDDGSVNVRDLGLLQQYLNGFKVIINEYAANVNGDKGINVRDYGLLQQYLNGWDVELKPSTPVEPEPPESILTEEERAFYQNIVDTENAWLASQQLPNGALPMTYAKSGTLKICPYFSDFAALSMLNQPELYAENVKAYMDWHFAHLNTAATDYNGVDGTIYDYHVVVSNGQVVREEYINGTPSYDSTDSYAATFLEVVQKYVEKTGDKAYAIAHKAEIERIVNALYSTMVNGLTLAKPDYAIKYLMDNCEVYEGMVKAAKLYDEVLVPADASLAATRDKLVADAALVAQKIEEKMWTGSYYHPALGRDDSVAYTFNWDNYYPSATAQTFPIMFGLISPESERAQALYNQYCAKYDWENFNHPDTFYWGSNALTAAMMKDTARVKTYMEIYARVAMRNHAYPLYNSDAAKTCMAAYLMLQL